VLKLQSSHAILATARPSYLVLALVALNLMQAFCLHCVRCVRLETGGMDKMWAARVTKSKIC